MKKRAMFNLKLTSTVMVFYFAFLFVYNFNYIDSLNEYFGILTESTDMITAVNESRYQMNLQFVKTDFILGLIGAGIILVEISCISSLLRLYKDLAFKDPLTGALSRACLDDTFDTIERKKNIEKITYYLFDMNYLKQVNDGYGHKVGDDFLIAMYQCIKNVFDSYGKVYRLAGDEFVGISYLPNLDPDEVADRLDREVKRYNDNRNRTKVLLSFSKGCCMMDFDYKDEYFRDTLYTEADNAMYEEKEAFHRIHPKNECIDRETKEVKIRKI